MASGGREKRERKVKSDNSSCCDSEEAVGVSRLHGGCFPFYTASCVIQIVEKAVRYDFWWRKESANKAKSQRKELSKNKALTEIPLLAWSSASCSFRRSVEVYLLYIRTILYHYLDWLFTVHLSNLWRTWVQKCKLKEIQRSRWRPQGSVTVCLTGKSTVFQLILQTKCRDIYKHELNILLQSLLKYEIFKSPLAS